MLGTTLTLYTHPPLQSRYHPPFTNEECECRLLEATHPGSGVIQIQVFWLQGVFLLTSTPQWLRNGTLHKITRGCWSCKERVDTQQPQMVRKGPSRSYKIFAKELGKIFANKEMEVTSL